MKKLFVVAFALAVMLGMSVIGSAQYGSQGSYGGGSTLTNQPRRAHHSRTSRERSWPKATR